MKVFGLDAAVLVRTVVSKN